jgi:hypothetical protein
MGLCKRRVTSGRGEADVDDTTLEDLEERICLRVGQVLIHGSTTDAPRA